MRSTLWSRAARPKLNGSRTPTSTPSPWRPSAIRQTASGPVQRHITINDVFTLLLTPILATALLADTSWKDKRRKDWAHKIAEIEAETEEIRSRATQSWQTLQSRSLGLGAAQQRRQYSSVALRSQPGDEGDLPSDEPQFRDQRITLEELDYEPTWVEAAPKHNQMPRYEVEQEPGNFSPVVLERSERLRRLLAIKLALTLTIYLNTGVSPSKVRKEIRIPDLNPDLSYDPAETQDLPRLLEHMHGVCAQLEALKRDLPDGAVPIQKETTNEDSQLLQDDICALSERYETGAIAMPEFVASYTIAVLKSPVAPTSKAYLALFRGVVRNVGGPSHDLAMQTLFAWEQSRLPIRDRDLFTIFSELGRLKNVQKFDGLMRDLTMSPSPLNTVGKWTWEQTSDIQVPVPKSYHPALLLSCVHCALRFDQPQKAEAWSEILRRTWLNVNDPNQKTPLQLFFTNWLRYCEWQGNWRRGVSWLDAAQKWAVSVATFDMYSLQRLAVGMLALCFACGKSKEYEEILHAAIDSGIPSVDPRHFLSRSPRRAICKEWDHLHYEAYRLKRDTRTDQEKVRAFQSKVRALVQRLLPDRDSPDVEWRETQKDKPNSLVADPAPQVSNQTSAHALALWQKIHASNQEALAEAKTAAQKLQVQCTAQEIEMRQLRYELERQKKLVHEVVGMKTNAPFDDQIQQRSGMTDDFFPLHPESQPQGPRVADILPLSRIKLSGQGKDKEPTKADFSPNDFLLSHLVKA